MDKIEVTQADAIKFLESACRNWTDMPSISTEDIADVAGALQRFVTNRLATRTDATPVGYLVHHKSWPDEYSAIRLTAADKAAGHTETPLYTHPPATDVAALVEAAKVLRNDAVMLLNNAEGCAVSHYGFDAETRGMPQWLTDCRTRIVDAFAALAPFTKGQNDDAVR